MQTQSVRFTAEEKAIFPYRKMSPWLVLKKRAKRIALENAEHRRRERKNRVGYSETPYGLPHQAQISALPIEYARACRGKKRIRDSRSKYSPVAEDRKHQQQ